MNDEERDPVKRLADAVEEQNRQLRRQTAMLGALAQSVENSNRDRDERRESVTALVTRAHDVASEVENRADDLFSKL